MYIPEVLSALNKYDHWRLTAMKEGEGVSAHCMVKSGVEEVGSFGRSMTEAATDAITRLEDRLKK